MDSCCHDRRADIREIPIPWAIAPGAALPDGIRPSNPDGPPNPTTGVGRATVASGPRQPSRATMLWWGQRRAHGAPRALPDAADRTMAHDTYYHDADLKRFPEVGENRPELAEKF